MIRRSKDAPNITQTLKMAKLVTQKLHEHHNQTTMDYYDKNTSEYLDVNLAEFSSIYQPRVNSLALMESNYFDIEDIKREVENMKLEAKKSTSTSYIKNKMYDATNFLKSEKKRILEETLQKHVVEQNLQKFLDKKITLPNIATEVVKRCSQPQSYIKFRKNHDFLPIKTKSPEGYKSQLFTNIKRRKQRHHRVPHLKTPIFPSIFEVLPKLDDIKKGQETRKKLRSKKLGSQLIDLADLPDSSQNGIKTRKNSRVSNLTDPLNLVLIESIDDSTVLEVPTIEGQTISINQYLNDQNLFDNQVQELGKVEVQAQIDISIIDETIQKEMSVKEEMSLKKTINLDEVPITIKNVRPKSKNNYKYQKQFLGMEEQGELLIKLIEKYDIAIQKDKSKINLPSIKSSRFPSSNRSSTTSLISENGPQIGLAMRQKVLIGVLKLMSIEMNLNQRTFRDLLLSGLKYLLEKEISGQQQLQSQQQTISIKSQGESSEWVESLSQKLDTLKYINSEISNLHQMQRDIKVDQKGIQLEIGQVDALFDEYLQFYNLLKDGDMPHQQDAEILFQVRKLEDIWQSKDQYLQIREFKQLSNQTGLLMIQKYEHNKFVKENAKRRHELKQIG